MKIPGKEVVPPREAVRYEEKKQESLALVGRP